MRQTDRDRMTEFQDVPPMLIYLIVFDFVVYFLVCSDPGGSFMRISMGINFSFAAVILAATLNTSWAPTNTLHHVMAHLIALIIFWGFFELFEVLFVIGASLLILGVVWTLALNQLSSWFGIDSQGIVAIVITIVSFMIVVYVIWSFSGSWPVMFTLDWIVCSIYASLALNLWYAKGWTLSNQAFYIEVTACTDESPVALCFISVRYLISLCVFLLLRLYLYKRFVYDKNKKRRKEERRRIHKEVEEEEALLR